MVDVKDGLIIEYRCIERNTVRVGEFSSKPHMENLRYVEKMELHVLSHGKVCIRAARSYYGDGSVMNPIRTTPAFAAIDITFATFS